MPTRTCQGMKKASREEFFTSAPNVSTTSPTMDAINYESSKASFVGQIAKNVDCGSVSDYFPRWL